MAPDESAPVWGSPSDILSVAVPGGTTARRACDQRTHDRPRRTRGNTDMGIRKTRAICGACVLGAASLSCGGGGDDGAGGGSGGGDSYADISTSLSKPSGTLASSNAVSVAEAYQKAGPGGGGFEDDEKQVKQVNGVASQSCAAGGTMDTKTSGVTQDSVHAVVAYNKCCQEKDCCLDGDADVFYAPGGTYQYCTAYDVTSTCGGQSQRVNTQGCFSAAGWTYLVKVDGKTYTVAGNYANGSGKLTIQDASATWTCNYSNNKGSCTGGASAISF